MENKIILLGGSAGTGKTTLANALCCELNFNHRIGTGLIRESLKTLADERTNPSLYSYTFRPKPGQDLIQNFLDQSKVICDAVNLLIKRSRNEGTSIVIEGNHLLPELINLDEVDLFVILDCDLVDLKKRLVSDTHSKRKITDEDIHNIETLKKYILSTASEHKIKIISNKNLKDSVKHIVELLS